MKFLIVLLMVLFHELESSNTGLKIDTTLGPVKNDAKLKAQVVGGSVVTPNTYGEQEWMAAIRIKGFHHCGGSLIAKNLMLTVAHCARTSLSDLMVITGRNNFMGFPNRTHPNNKIPDLEPNEVRMTVKAIYNYPLHRLLDDNTHEHDIAIWILEGGKDLSVVPTLATSIKPSPLDESLITMGWGKTCVSAIGPKDSPATCTDESGDLPKDYIPPASKFLKQLALFELNHLCYYKSFAVNRQICAVFSSSDGYYLEGIYFGDSGGPLFRPAVNGLRTVPEIVGLTSYGGAKKTTSDSKPSLFVPFVFTRVAYYYNWIFPEIIIKELKKVTLTTGFNGYFYNVNFEITPTFASTLTITFDPKKLLIQGANSRIVSMKPRSSSSTSVTSLSSVTSTVSLKFNDLSVGGQSLKIEVLIDNGLGLKWTQIVGMNVPQ